MVCYVESGYPSLPDLVKYRQHKCFKKMWDDRSSISDDPLSFAMRKVMGKNTSEGKIVSEMIEKEVFDRSVLLEEAKRSVAESDGSRCIAYKDINPTVSVSHLH